ncbi:hypothetical protein G4V62_08185 [Bacillaceae bacterium SIJ1]|uniref:DUF6470 family protein n=1 Tax=Litoribacterium kuwaitense TaxID=1398745 RepID=UPI0013ED01D3|nr:DUF6470 family protein [Litoribacterium kuwaitense]NGP44938.1 hypothetical protein [Litoribacterium kuwaitense]
MDMPRLQIKSTDAQLGIHTTQPQQTIRQPKAEMSIRQPKATVRIQSEPASLQIDQTRAWESMGLFSVRRAIEKSADRGQQSALAFIGDIASAGDELMKIERGGDPLNRQAAEKHFMPQYEFNIGWIPEPFSVSIRARRGELSIDVTSHSPQINVEPQKPIHLYEPGSVRTYLKKAPTLSISVVR